MSVTRFLAKIHANSAMAPMVYQFIVSYFFLGFHFDLYTIVNIRPVLESLGLHLVIQAVKIHSEYIGLHNIRQKVILFGNQVCNEICNNHHIP